MFYLEHDLDLTKAAQWMKAAIEQQPNAFHLHYYQARLLAKQGDKAGAIAAAQRSIELAAKQNEVAKAEYTRLNQNLIATLGQ